MNTNIQSTLLELSDADLATVSGGDDTWDIGDTEDGCTIVGDSSAAGGMRWSCDALTDGWTPTAGE